MPWKILFGQQLKPETKYSQSCYNLIYKQSVINKDSVDYSHHLDY